MIWRAPRSLYRWKKWNRSVTKRYETWRLKNEDRAALISEAVEYLKVDAGQGDEFCLRKRDPMIQKKSYKKKKKTRRLLRDSSEF
jgi:hypothetical protein